MVKLVDRPESTRYAGATYHGGLRGVCTLLALVAVFSQGAGAVEYPQRDANDFLYEAADIVVLYDTDDGDTLRAGYTGINFGGETCTDTITVADTNYSAIESAVAGDIICIEEGDHTGKSDNNIDFTTNGTSGNRITLIGVHSGDWDLHTRPESQTTKVIIDCLDIDADWLLISGVKIEPGCTGSLSPIDFANTSQNVILHNIEVDCSTMSTSAPNCLTTLPSSDDHFFMNLTLYDCVIVDGSDRIGITLNSDNTGVTGARIRNCTDLIQDHCRDGDCWYVNNDLYFTDAWYRDCVTEAVTTSGNCMQAENIFDMKRGNATNFTRLEHNRMRGWRRGVGNEGASGGSSGYALIVHASSGSSGVPQRHIYERNILWDGQGGFRINTNKPDDWFRNGVIRANIFDGLTCYDCGASSGSAAGIQHTAGLGDGADNLLIAFNTWVNIPSAGNVHIINGLSSDSPHAYINCNLILYSNISFNGQTLSSGTNGRWAWDTSSTVDDTPENDGAENISTLTAAMFGDYTYTYWMVDGSSATRTITGIIPVGVPAGMQTCGGDFTGFGDQ